MKYTVVAISGSYGELISDTIRAFGGQSDYSSIGATEGHAVIITYPWESYEFVMTQHFVLNILGEYNHGNKESFEQWIKSFYNPFDFTNPNDITLEDWALHVIDAYKHIGTDDPLNGVKSSLVKRLGDGVPYTEIKLHDIRMDRDKVLETLSKMLDMPITDHVTTFFNNYLNNVQVQFDGYLDTIRKTKLTFSVDPENKFQYNYINNLGYPGSQPTE